MLLAANAEVHGDFILTGATIGSPGSEGFTVNLAGACVGGNVEFSPALSDREIAIRGDIQINGSVNGEGLRCGGRLTLSAVAITGDLFLNFSELTSFWALPVEDRRVRIGGSLHLSAVKSRPWISLQGISIAGEFLLLGSETSDLHLTVGWLSSGTEEYEHSIVPSTVGRFVMRCTEVKGNLQMPFIQVNGTKYDSDRRGVVLEGSTIGGSVEFWSPWKIRDTWRINSAAGAGARCPIRCWRYSAAIIGDVRIENSTIRGELNLSFVKATGRIDLGGSHVIGGVLFCSTQTVSAEIEDPAEKDDASREWALDPLMRASASELVLRMLRIDNDLDLTGLSVFRDHRQDNPRKKQSGAIDATHLSVKGKIKAHEQSDGSKAYIEVPGKFDLSNVEAAELEISGDSFPLASAVSAAMAAGDIYPDGIVLSGGTIDAIVIPEIYADRRGRRGRPFPVALDDLSVKTWAINADTNDVRPYLHLLQKDQIFRRSNYAAIETYLRNRGEDHPATKVYRHMWKRERAELSKNFDWRPYRWNWRVWQWEPRFWRWTWPAQFLRWVKLCFYGPILGFGTNLWPLFIFIVLLSVLAYPIYRHPANIEPSLARLAAHAARDTRHVAQHGVSPVPSDWTNADAIWMEFRYQVPIIALALRDEWTMRDEPRAIYDLSAFWANEGFPSCLPAKDFEERLPSKPPAPPPPPPCNTGSVFIIPIGAEDVAGIFTILSYIMWPLLIAFLLRKLLRTREA
jgi:cytoskeletal protein CcmA (bactofilin family)